MSKATISWFQQSVHRSRNGVFSETKIITPEIAEILLTQNPDNRRLRETKIGQMISDMKNDRWSFNGEPIIFAKTGELNDGQHRLTAIVQSKKAQSMLIVFGVDRDTRTTLDQGASRSAGDYLQMEGVANAAQLSSITRWVIAFETGKRSKDITHSQILERAEKDRGIQTSARYANTNVRRLHGIATGTAIGFCHYILLSVDTTDGLAFMETICHGEEIRRGDPAYTARERLRTLQKGHGVAAQIEIILRAWNAYREKRQLHSIPILGRFPELVPDTNKLLAEAGVA